MSFFSCALVMPGPMRLSMGLPGTIWIREKTITVTTRNMGISSRVLLIRYIHMADYFRSQSSTEGPSMRRSWQSAGRTTRLPRANTASGR